MMSELNPQLFEQGPSLHVRHVELLAEDDPQRHREKLARIVLDEMYQFVGLLDVKGTLLEVNRAALEGGGIRRDDILGRPFWESRWWLVSAGTQAQLRRAVARAALGAFIRYDVEVYGQAAGEETIIIDFSLIPVKDKAGRVVFLLAEGRNITEKKRAEAELARKNQELEQLLSRVRELDELKSQLFANVSHELRTPLTLILGPADALLARGHNLTEPQRRDVAVMRRNAATLLKHVNDLLDISRLDAGKMTLSYAEADLAWLVRKMAGLFEALAPQRRISFVVDVPERLLAQVDVEKLERVVLNLLSNAFKFTPEGGRIKLSLRETLEGRALLSVQDSGPGVRPELRASIFERFRQGEGGTTRQFGGTGLGLSIVRDFVELHGGLVSVTDAPGGGALFLVVMPRRAPEGVRVRELPAPEEEALQAEMALRGTLDELISLSGTHARAEARSVEEQGRGDRPRVLVVEDNPELNRFLVETLRDEYRVTTAFDGMEGLEKATTLAPDLILTDIMMPRMSGDALVAALRELPALAQVPIIVLSAKADDALRLKLLNGGAQDYVVKPFSAEDVLARVKNLVSLKLARGALERQNEELKRLKAQVEAQAREDIRLREERFRSLVTATAQVVWTTDVSGSIVEDSPTWRAFTGQSFEEARGYGWLDAVHPEDRARVELEWRHAVRTRSVYETEYRLMRPDGGHTPTMARAAPVVESDGTVREWVGMNLDTSEKKRAEAALRESEAHFRMLGETIPQLVWVARPDGRAEFVNRHYSEYTGITFEGAKNIGWLALVHPEDRERVGECWQRSLRLGEPYEVEHRFRRASDGEYRWFLTRALPVRDGRGQVTRWFGTSTDIQERKLAEAELRRAVRLRDDFLSVAAHELRTPLTSLKLQLELISRAAEDAGAGLPARLESKLKAAHRQANRLNQLNEALLDVSRIGTGRLHVEREEVDFVEVVQEMLQRLAPEFERAGCMIGTDLSAEVRGQWDGLRLEQVVVNLLMNATRYGAGKPIEVRLGREGGAAVFSVRDHGIGIAPEDQQRIFRRFERAVSVHNYGGLGLGLYISSEIVSALGGSISVASQPGAGATFTVRLPLAGV
ncbi:PAS domain S-box protein [Archangium violaceum]|uniref:ATP-binding protein n=1 Tax=Archangium violaceum TaxID=83451 RepID=UPI00193B1057|nr:ATP-binding protein [Archangium violaceum]QRK08849.1 PAS domain S-box protein [Archangium violaceum]